MEDKTQQRGSDPLQRLEWPEWDTHTGVTVQSCCLRPRGRQVLRQGLGWAVRTLAEGHTAADLQGSRTGTRLSDSQS